MHTPTPQPPRVVIQPMHGQSVHHMLRLLHVAVKLVQAAIITQMIVHQPPDLVRVTTVTAHQRLAVCHMVPHSDTIRIVSNRKYY